MRVLRTQWTRPLHRPPFITAHRQPPSIARLPLTQLSLRCVSTVTQGASQTNERPITPYTQNRDRNNFFRHAYLADDEEVARLVEQKLGSVFVDPIRTYESEDAKTRSRDRAVRSARVQVGFDKIAERFSSQVPDWTDIFDLLKKTTPKTHDRPKMAAMRVVLPTNEEIDAKNGPFRFVESVSGLVAMLRIGADSHSKSSIILRGKSSILKKAADELITLRPDCQIYGLGDVIDEDYTSWRLWPAPSGSKPATDDNGIWVHVEPPKIWIDCRYEEIPVPATWTKDSFNKYIDTVVSGRLRPQLASRLYNRTGPNKTADTDGVRVKLLMNAFQDPDARAFVTPQNLRAAITFMAPRGGHISSADKLMTLSEGWGIPTDTHTFNAMLRGYVHKRDALYFFRFLKKMRERCYQPNATTWLLFLELVKRDVERRRIIAAMFEHDLFRYPETRRAIADLMADADAHAAFRSGMALDVFLDEQASRYGQEWFSESAFNRIVDEFLRYHSSSSHAQLHQAITKMYPTGQVPASTLNVVLHHVAACTPGDFESAVWAVENLEHNGHELSDSAFAELLVICVTSEHLQAYSTALIYAIFQRRMRYRARKYANMIAGIRVGSRAGVWAHQTPHILSKNAAKRLKGSPVSHPQHMIAGVEWALLSEYDGYQPVEPLSVALRRAADRVDDEARRYSKLASPSKDETDAFKALPALEILLQNKAGEQKTMVLDASFDKATMLKRRYPEERLLESRAQK